MNLKIKTELQSKNKFINIFRWTSNIVNLINSLCSNIIVILLKIFYRYFNVMIIIGTKRLE